MNKKNNSQKNKKILLHPQKKEKVKSTGVLNGQDLNEKHQQVLDIYYRGENTKSGSVMQVYDTVTDQSTACTIFKGIASKPSARKYINAIRSRLRTETHISIEQILNSHIDADNVTLKDLAHVRTLEDIKKLPHRIAKHIESWEIDERTETNRAGNEVTVSKYKFKLVSKMETRKEITKIIGGYEIDNKQKAKTLDITSLDTSDQLTLLKILTKKPSQENKTIDITPE